MIENANDKPQSLLKAESDLEKAKHRLEEEKKKTNEKKRKADNHNKIVWGGIVKKYFPKADCFEQAEMEKILKAAIDSMDCKRMVSQIKTECKNKNGLNNHEMEKNEIMNELGVDQATLMETAKANLSEQDYSFKSMRDVIVDMMFPEGVPENG